MLSPQLDDIVHLLKTHNARLASEPSVLQLREHADALYDALDIPQGVRFIDGDEVHGTWTTFHGARRNQAILYLHGGGYVMHTPQQYRTLTAALALEAQREVFAVDYRRAPEHPFPYALHDAFNAYKWLYERLGEDPSIVIAGDSAGGGLAVALMLMCDQHGMPMPRGAFLISPWTDLSLSAESIRSRAALDPIVSEAGLRFFARSYLQEHQDPHHPLASPLFGDLAGLPPMLIHVGGNEALLDDATRLAARAAAAGVDTSLKVWPSMFHEWHMWHTRLPEARAAVMEGAAFIRARFDA
ncbi:alpha/beta hydrolase [Cupriavidus sp. RAF12]|uniref:alpha/beta hydrolase n=1 Tax=Cupriavidus sp. RAF12 TaxID=3233050 RepID=UPI003F90DF0E